MTHPTREQVSAAAHAGLDHANPLAVGQMAELVERVARARPCTVIDVGSGFGSFAVALASRAPGRVRAVEPNGLFVERARAAAGSARLEGEIDFQERALLEDEGERFDAVVCIGSSGAIGTPAEALARCRDLLAKDGVLVFADLVWAADPPPAFLDLLGGDAATYWRRSEAEDLFAGLGLDVVWSCSATDESWEAYERGVLAGRLELADQVGGEEGAALRDRAQAWYRAYEAHGSSCFGFDAFVAVGAHGPAARPRVGDPS